MGLGWRSEEMELDRDPVFDFGAKVRSTKQIRNDGTYPGAEIGDLLVRKGDIGYVTNIGTFLQQFYIYSVDFYERGRLVGMRGKELELVAPAQELEETEA